MRARDHRRGRIGAHAAGVGTCVAVAQALVILRRGQRQDVLAVGHDDEAGFLARQEFLDDDLIAGGSRTARRTSDCAVGDGFIRGVDDDHALAGGEAAGLDHDRRALPAHPVGVEVLARERRDRPRSGMPWRLQEFLGEGLGAFELRGRLARPEAAQPGGRERIDHAGHQRCLRAR